MLWQKDKFRTDILYIIGDDHGRLACLLQFFFRFEAEPHDVRQTIRRRTRWRSLGEAERRLFEPQQDQHRLQRT